MDSPMLRNATSPADPRILHRHVGVQPLGDGVADQGGAFLLQHSSSRRFFATNASIRAVSRSRKAAMARCSPIPVLESGRRGDRPG